MLRLSWIAGGVKPLPAIVPSPRPSLFQYWVRMLALAAGLLSAGCGPKPIAITDPQWEPYPLLSQYGLFEDGPAQRPAAGVIPYDLNTPLFSDYSTKYRFVRVPPGTSASYVENDVLSFPVGTILVKTFAYLHDLRDPSKGQRLLETRLLIHQPDGWKAYPYLWNDEQTDARYFVAGRNVDVAWTHTDGSQRSANYIIPNTNQCAGCHIDQDKKIQPIGPKARNLNKDFAYPKGPANQLVHWTQAGALQGAPPPDQCEKVAVWNDPSTGSVEQRARAYLDVNCAHCHSPSGPAKNSGLDLRIAQDQPMPLGIYKLPVAAGRGSGGRHFDIVPGDPDQSILVFRMESTEADIMMPELPRTVVDEEGVALIRQWIAQLPPTEPVDPSAVR